MTHITSDLFVKFLDAARSQDPTIRVNDAYRAFHATRSKTLEDVQAGLPGVELTDEEWRVLSLATRAILGQNAYSAWLEGLRIEEGQP